MLQILPPSHALQHALITFEWTFAAVSKVVSGLGATLSTAVLTLVTPKWVFAAVGRARFEFFTFIK